MAYTFYFQLKLFIQMCENPYSYLYKHRGLQVRFPAAAQFLCLKKIHIIVGLNLRKNFGMKQSRKKLDECISLIKKSSDTYREEVGIAQDVTLIYHLSSQTIAKWLSPMTQKPQKMICLGFLWLAICSLPVTLIL